MSVASSSGSSAVRVKQKVVVPIMDTVDTTKKLGEIIANVELVLPKITTSAQRIVARNLVRSLVANAVTVAATENFEAVF
jgi:hypothetical protein